jgi:putative tryptophan/tyrosine transport system substrate-binding protein
MHACRLGRRRSFLLVLGMAAAMLGFPLERAADAAQRVVRIGFVHPQSVSTATHGPSAFWERLRELGYVEGQNLVIESRWADGQMEQLPALIGELIGRKVDVLVTFGTQTAIAAKNATSTIPIVGVAMGEPLRTGLAPSLARPGGNLTGTSVGWAEGIGGKWLELLQETVPHLSTVAVIENPDTPIARELAKELEAIAPTRSLRLQLIEVREPGALDRAFEQAKRKAQAVLILPYPVISAHRAEVTALAAKYRLPTMYYLRDYVEAGGLIAYAPDLVIQFRRAADYVDKILKGARPSDLPIEQPTQWSLVVNLKTAKSLGLTIPESILVRADEVIR